MQYTFSEESRRAFSGFLITISDQSNHSVSYILDKQYSKVRKKYVNSTVLREEHDFVGDSGILLLIAFDEDRNQHKSSSLRIL